MASSEELFEAIEAGDVAGVRELLADEPGLASARDASGVSALMRARYRLDLGLVEAIRSRAGDLDVFEAASFGDLDRLTMLLDEDPSLANTRSGDGFSALHLAAFFGKPEATELLLARGAEVDGRGTGWRTGTALHSAASNSHTDVARLLLNADANPDARQSHGFMPLHAAAMNGNADLARLLLERGADREATNDDGRSARDYASDGGDADTIATLGGA